jgi:hypothetical protein
MRRLFLIAVAAMAVGCSSDSTGPSADIIGNYTLKTVNGSPLPYAFDNGNTLVTDVLTLNANGSYGDIATLSDGNVVPDVGSFFQSGNILTFSPAGATSTYQGTLDGTSLTERFSDGTVEVYQRS